MALSAFADVIQDQFGDAIASAAWTLSTGGNIAKASTAVANQMMTLAWDGAKWWPRY